MVGLQAAVKEILPFPLAPRPINGLLLVHEYDTVPGPSVGVVNTTLTGTLQQVITSAGWFTTGVGFTVTVAVIGVPLQVRSLEVKVGVIVKVTTCGLLVLLVSVPLISPVPLAGMPVAFTKLSLVQLYTVPGTLPDNTMVVIAEPEHVVCAGGVATAFGTGFTSTVAVIGVPRHVTPALV